MNNTPIIQEFEQVQGIINLHRSRALQAVNNENLLTAWEVGAYVSARLKAATWGSKTVTQLSEYLRKQDPTLKGYSRRNLYNMVQFFDTYSNSSFSDIFSKLKLSKQLVQSQTGQIVQTPSAQLQEKSDNGIVPTQSGQLEMQMPAILNSICWSSHCDLLSLCSYNEQRIFYMLYANRERLDVRELRRAVKTDAYTHLLKGKEFQSIGMKQQYPQAGYMFKDVAFLDFLGLPQRHSEHKLQQGLVTHIKDFILELGKDFFFVGNEYPINVGGETFKIDLLFFNRALQCFVAVELKTTKFKPADMGQLEFYLEALDQDVKRSNENPSIGILLCKESNQNVVKYALNRSMSPTMVAKYEKELIRQDVLQHCLNEFCQFLEDENEEISSKKHK
ncbi:MAG: DUF1016 family protein [Prevotellaceae bacterium]|nr:DUF1016 family protein [Prevotellaceae bacterium]